MRLSAISILLGMTAALAPSFAFSVELPSAETESSKSIQGFASSNPDCADFTDQCITCSQQSGELVCSTPKIACIQKELTCTRSRLPDAEQK